MLLQIIKKSSLLLCVGAMVLFTSCNSEEVVEESADAVKESVNETQHKLIDAESTNDKVVEGGAVNTNEGIENTPLNTAPPVNNGVALNPPHGEPGHDCAVPVGQPLNAAAGANVNAPTVNTPKVNNNVRLNPAHGEPGHDCAVPVGQPLN
ncbi:hypothetical protein [Brumimicrobium sp.]|uniref:hypothetical protein n=1 Tax=Brumimicrobium sp. TaxID=2029867 RepID=UPI003A95B6D1